jgi:phosphatidylserine/phosphatidylglycerophosphate/cardiolipin synthase-like enzyme
VTPREASVVAAWFLTPTERGNAATAIDRRRGAGAPAHTDGNEVRVLIHGADYFARLLAELHQAPAGSWIHFTDWRGDPDERLDGRPGSEIARVLARLAGRGVAVRGLVWRSHADQAHFSEEENLHLVETVNEAGGEVLLDERVRRDGSHHQKLFVIRHPDEPARDVAFVGGIDLCHGRRDGAGHDGDEQVIELDARYGPRPAWHDLQLEVRGPAVGDLAFTFRERWEDPTPLDHRNPWRMVLKRAAHEPRRPDPLPPMPDDPSPAGRHAVQVLRTYPAKRPAVPFAPDGERSIARAYLKAFHRARRLVYVEDQYLWSGAAARSLADRLRAEPGLHLVAVVPRYPDQDGRLSGPPYRIGQQRALEVLRAAGGDRVTVLDLEAPSGWPIYVHAKVCVIDDVWASVGSDNFNRRSWSSDTEVACAVQDTRVEDRAGSAPRDAFALRLRRELVGEHVGLDPDDVPDDHDALWDLMASRATALDEWYTAGSRPRGRRHVPRPKAPLKGTSVRWRRRSGAWQGAAGVERPPGRLRRLDPPTLTRLQALWAPRVYDLFDPDGTIGRDDRI